MATTKHILMLSCKWFTWFLSTIGGGTSGPIKTWLGSLS
jgi:hypothetical protein